MHLRRVAFYTEPPVSGRGLALVTLLEYLIIWCRIATQVWHWKCILRSNAVDQSVGGPKFRGQYAGAT